MKKLALLLALLAVGVAQAQPIPTAPANTILGRGTTGGAPTPQTSPSIPLTGAYRINGVNFISTATDANGFQATCVGYNSCVAGLGTGIDQTYIGYYSGGALNSSPMTAGENSMVGFYAGATLTSGSQNACIGAGCMWHETTGAHDIAIGSDAMRNTSVLNGAVAIGWAANRDWINTNGIAIGTQALAGQFQVDNINFTASINISGVMNVTAFTTNLAYLGGLTVGQLITGSGVPASSAITSQLSGTTGGIGTYQLNAAGTGTVVSSTAMLAAAAAIGTGNVAIGYLALQGLAATTAANNLGIGSNVMTGLTTATYDQCVGNNSCGSITSATNDTVFGGLAASGLTTGSSDVFMGYGSGFSATTAAQNTCVGWETCFGVMTGTGINTAVGYEAGLALTSATQDTLIGGFAGLNATSSQGITAIGYAACKLVTGANNTCLGDAVASTVLTTGTGNIEIGTSNATTTPAAASSNQINIGGLLFWNKVSLAAPVVSSCGTTPAIDAHANNRSGTVTVGTVTAASCTVTFAGGGYTTWDHCRVTSQGLVTSFAYSYTLTVLTVTGTSLVGDLFDYDCDGY